MQALSDGACKLNSYLNWSYCLLGWRCFHPSDGSGRLLRLIRPTFTSAEAFECCQPWRACWSTYLL